MSKENRNRRDEPFSEDVEEVKVPTVSEVLDSVTWANVDDRHFNAVERALAGELTEVDARAIIGTLLPIAKQFKLDNEYYKAELAKR